MPLWRLFEGR